MISNKADSLVLEDGDLVKVEIAGQLRPLTKSPLTSPQIVALLKEIGSTEAKAAIDAGKPATLSYVSTDGAFLIRAMLHGDKWHVVAKIDDEAEFKRVTGQFKLSDLPPDTPSSSPVVPPMPPPPPKPAAARTSRAFVTPAAAAAAAVSSGFASSKSELDAIIPFDGIEMARATIDNLLRTMVEKGASDLHLRVTEPPILRHHGEMVRMQGLEPLTDEQLFAMTRSIMPQRNRIEYQESNDTDYAYELPGVARFRANAARDRNGPVAVFRQIPATVVTVEQMNITEEVQRLCFLTKGLVLVTGPTGSGKSTTLCALIDLVNRSRNDHVLTIEDPIEFVHQNKNCIITQRQVHVHTKSFKSALRAALREDPNVVLVGELRDLETVAIAIETAETGHLVFGTLHTTTAAGTVDRIIDQFPADRQEQIRVMLAESLKGVISQTLCKRVGGGRVAAREILLSIPSVTNLIREAKTFQIPSIMQTSRRIGMVTLNDALIAYVDSGEVEPKEAYMKAVEKQGFVQMLKARNLDVSFAETDPAQAAGAAGGGGGASGAGARPGMAAKPAPVAAKR
ncbi:MAG TPA: type IV pilus twitching motility protein PilT [Candidatus Limnocylindrales bacterium]|nr:type IV pilus twitching motility protein PilT [Candidatus Limnocylindrales bacterium]